MKINNCFQLAFKDICSKPAAVFQVIRSYVIIMMVVMISTLILQSVENYYDKVIYGTATQNSLYSNLELTQKGKFTENAKRNFEKIKEISDIESVSVYSDVDVPLTSNQSDYAYINLGRVSFITKNQSYQGVDDKSFDFAQGINDAVAFQLRFCLQDSAIFSADMKKEFEYFYPKEKLLVAGEWMSLPRDIVLSDYILQKFGIVDYNEILGEKITLKIDGKDYLKEYRLTGVVNSNFFRLKNQYMVPQILITGTMDEVRAFQIQNMNCLATVNNPSNSTKVYRYLEENALLGSIDYKEATAKSFYYTAQIRVIAKNIMLLVVLVVFLAIMMSISSITITQISSTLNYYGMLCAIGLKKKSLVMVFVIKQMILILVAGIIASGCAGALLIAINLFLKIMIENLIPISVRQVAYCSMLVILVVGILLGVLSIIIFCTKLKKSIIVMLKTHF